MLTDGSVVDATPTRNVDLYKALKGGLTNFGKDILDIPIIEIMDLTASLRHRYRIRCYDQLIHGHLL